MAGQLRDTSGRFAPSGRGRSKHSETRIKVFGGEIVYKDRGIDMPALQAGLKKALRRAQDLTPAFKAWQPTWLNHNAAVFDDEGPGWAPLNENYAAAKQKAVGDKPILEYTGRLRDSLTDEGSLDMIYVARPRTLQLGTEVPYSDPQQFGYKALPARPHDVLDFETFDVLVETVGSYIEQPFAEQLR